MFGSPHLTYVVESGVAWLTLNRPEARNALTRDMYRGIALACEEVDRDDEVEVMVIRGVDGVFCSGGDLLEGQQFLDGLGTESRANASLFGDSPSAYLPVDPVLAIQSTRKIVVAAVDGLCMGGGFMTAMTADICIASRESTFRVPEARLGVIDAWVASRLPRYIGMERAKYLILTCRAINGTTAAEWGLISAAVDATSLDDEVRSLVDDLKAGGPRAREAYKLLANRLLPDGEAMRSSYEVADEVFRSADAHEGLAAFRQKRSPHWTGRA